MKAEDLEELLEAGRETPELDYKASCPWNVATFAKDILAMSNMEDGGNIVIGVEELYNGRFNPCGIKPEDKETYNIDTMKDQMGGFADPHADFSLHFSEDKEERHYVVIRVHPFKEVPVICKKSSKDTNVGVMYFRNRDKCVQSAPISNSFDLRTVLERAAFMKMRKLHSAIESADLKVTPKQTVSEILDQEIQDL